MSISFETDVSLIHTNYPLFITIVLFILMSFVSVLSCVAREYLWIEKLPGQNTDWRISLEDKEY